MKNVILMLGVIAALTGCVPKRELVSSQMWVRSLQNDSAQKASKIAELESNVAQLQKRMADLNQQYSQLSKEAVNKETQLSQSQQSLQEQQRKLEQLQDLLNQQKAKSDELKKKMSDALNMFTSNELTVTQKNGKVYVSLSENLLFPSGSAVVNPKGKDALSRLAAVLNLNPDISVNIEGHTDTVPIRGKYDDNWALSTARATSIVRILVNDYRVDPTRVIASGHAFYDPVDTNETNEGRARNRRTEIILSPKLDELYKLIGT